MPSAPKEPQPQFSGTWTPNEVHDAFESGEITSTEFILLSVISALDRGGGPGCWAGNDYLAKRLHCKPKHIQKMVAKLIDLGFVSRSIPDGFTRYLKVCWMYGRGGRIKDTPPSHICDPYREERKTISAAPERAAEDGQKSGEQSKEKTSMVFIPSLTPKQSSKVQVEARHREWAEGLHKGLVAKLHVTVGWSKSSWAEQFARLEKDLDPAGGDPCKRIRSALEWFCQNIGKPYVPQVRSATRFRERLTDIEAAIRREETNTRSGVEPTERAYSVAREVEGMGWPKGSKAQLPVAVQVTLDGLKAFNLKLKAFKEANPDRIDLGGGRSRPAAPANRLAHRLWDTLPGSTDLAERWFREVHSEVRTWDAWSGDLVSMAFTGDVTHKRFSKWMREFAVEFQGTDSGWVDLARRLA